MRKLLSVKLQGLVVFIVILAAGLALAGVITAIINGVWPLSFTQITIVNHIAFLSLVGAAAYYGD